MITIGLSRLRPRKIIRDVRRKLAVGYWRHLGRVPQRLILIIATPRSGSTWLFDAVRSHPGVHVQTDPTVMALLGTQIGRRYPLDLSLEADGTNDIYINVTDKARLPDLSSATREDEPEATKMALEKIHPEYFGFDLMRLQHAVDCIGVDAINFVYIVREPRAAVQSFWKYKRRNPRWSGHIKIEQVAQHMADTYAVMQSCIKAYPGSLVDYDAMQRSMADVLSAIFDDAGRKIGLLELEPDAAEQLLETAVNATARERRDEASGFLEQTGEAPQPELFEAYLSENARHLESCVTSYREIVDEMAQNNRAGSSAHG